MLDVLLVEDSATNRMIAREMLKKRGCRVAEAKDGREGVTLAEARRFDLILMDISMPNMDGVSATRQIRKGGPNAYTPIIALTAHALPDDLAHFCAAGMTGTLTKPLSFQQLDETLADIPRDRQSAKPQGAEPATDPQAATDQHRL